MIRKFLLVLLVIFAGLALLLGGAFAYAQTRGGKAQIAGYIESSLEGPDQSARVEGLEGLVPFDIRLGRFSLADGKGAWLEVEDARLDLSPAALLGGRVAIREVGARRVVVHRQPDLPPAPETNEPFSLPQLPELPAALPTITVDKLLVERIELGAPVLGDAAVFRLDGRLGTSEAGTLATADLALKRIDEPTADLTLAAALDLGAGTLDLDLSASERGGLVATLAGRPQAGPLELKLAGKGALGDWQGRLDLAVANLVEADADIALALGAQSTLALDARLTPAEGALPPEIAAAIGDTLELELAAGEEAPGRFALSKLRLDGALLNATGSGSADLSSNALEGEITLTIADLARASGLAGTDLGGAATLVARASGTVSEPAFELVLDASAITADTLALDEATARLAITPLGPLDAPFRGAAIRGEGRILGLAVEGATPAPLEPLDWRIAGTVPLEGEAVIDEVALSGMGIELDAGAKLAMPSLAGTATIRAAIADLERVLAIAGVQPADGTGIRGSTTLLGDLVIGEQAQSVSGDLRLTTGDLAGLPGNAGAITGPAPELVAALDFRAGDSVRLDGIALKAAALDLAGNVALGLGEAGALGGRLAVDVPALGALEPVIGQKASGHAKLVLDLAGTLAAPDLTARLDAGDVAMAGQSFETIALDATAAGAPDAMAGHVKLEARQFGETLGLGTNWRLEGQRLTLDDIALSAPATTLSGGLEVDLASMLATGSLAGGSRDLGALQAWHGQELAGTVDLKLDLAASGGRQDADLAATLKGIAGSFGKLASARIEAGARDVLGKPAITATADIASFSQPGLAVESARLEAKGPLADLAVKVTARGSQGGDATTPAKPFDIGAEAQLAMLDTAKTARITTLAGTWQGQTIELAAPATLRMDEGVLDIDRLDLRIGEATIEGKATLDKSRVLASLDLRTLPLAMLEPFGAPPLQGNAKGRLDVTGTPGRPEVTLVLELADVRMNDPIYERVPPAQVRIDAGLKGGRLTAALEVAEITGTPTRASFAMPLGLSLEPFALDLKDNAPVEGRLTAAASLQRVGALAGLDGQRLGGTLKADLALAGRLDAPVIEGEARIENGSIEDSISGIVLTDLQMILTGNDRRLDITEFSAKGRSGGRIRIEGGASLDPAENFPYAFKVDSDETILLDNELGQAVVTALLDIAGDATRGKVAGTITLDRADLQIPGGGGGVEVASLDVTDSRTGEIVNGMHEEEAPSGPGYEMALDIVLDVPARLFVRGRGLDSEWGGKLDIKGTAAAPQIDGSIDFRRGYLDFLDRRFDITEGEIQFTGGSLIPEITLTAQAQGDSMTAIVSITGEATDPDFELDSDPSLPQDEILADLLFERDVSQITPSQGLKLAAAIAQLEGGGVDTLGKLRSAVGLDTLDVGGSSADEATASAGKYVSDNVFVEVEKGLASSSAKARVEVELTPNVTLNTEVSEDAETGVGIEWRFDY